MSVQYEKEVEYKFDFEEEEVLAMVIEACLDYVSCPYESTVSVTLVDSETIHQLNKEYREIDRPTDVLSFPMIDYATPGDFSFLEDEGAETDYFDPESGELLLGDIILSVDRILEQAEEYGHSVKREFAFLTAHSMFHLFGYDHMEEEERKEMERMQREVLESIGICR